MGLSLVEVLLFAIDPYVSLQGFYSFDPDMGFRVNPYARHGGARANAFGFNDRDYALGEHPGIFRLLILGDSFNWIGGTLCNYTRVLEQLLAEDFGKDRGEVINAVYSATHTAEQYHALRKFGMQYKPDLVILGFFAGNDFVDGYPDRLQIGLVGTITKVDTTREPHAVLWERPLILRSRLFALVRDRYRQWRTSGGPSYPLPSFETIEEWNQFCERLDQATRRHLSDENYFKMVHSRMELGRRNRRSSWKTNEDFILNALDNIHQLVKDNDAGFMVVAYPAEFQVNPILRSKVLASSGRNEDEYIDAYQQNLLANHSRQNSIEFHDLLPPFRQAQRQGQGLYIVNNTHWNWAGNQLAAELLYNLLAPRIREFLAP